MVNKILCKVVPVKEVPGLLPAKKKLRKPALMELSKRNILYAMRYAKIFAIIDDVEVLISSSAKIDELMNIVPKTSMNITMTKKDTITPVKAETPTFNLSIEPKYVEEEVTEVIEDEVELQDEVIEEQIIEEEKPVEQEKASFDKSRFVKPGEKSQKFNNTNKKELNKK